MIGAWFHGELQILLDGRDYVCRWRLHEDRRLVIRIIGENSVLAAQRARIPAGADLPEVARETAMHFLSTYN